MFKQNKKLIFCFVFALTFPCCIIRLKTWLSTLEIVYLDLCLSDETLKAVGPFYLDSEIWCLFQAQARGSKRSHQSALEMCNLS